MFFSRAINIFPLFHDRILALYPAPHHPPHAFRLPAAAHDHGFLCAGARPDQSQLRTRPCERLDLAVYLAGSFGDGLHVWLEPYQMCGANDFEGWEQCI